MQPKSKNLFRLLSTALMLISAHAKAAWGKDMSFGVNGFSLESYSPQMLVTIMCALVGAVVYAVLIWSLVKYRRSNDSKAAPFHPNTVIEIIWSIIPILILVAIVIPSIYSIT
jgi:cytochrome c oxidase subunit II